MNLALKIEFLTGVCRSAVPARDEADWPPQPDRVFSALVATWAARGLREDERKALEWLEQQEPPTVQASKYFPRSVLDVYVPPNDAEAPRRSLNWEDMSQRMQDRYLEVMPSRGRKPRKFPVACPDDPVMALVWPNCPEIEMLEMLNEIARDLSYLGHSASLVCCRFSRESSAPLSYQGQRALRRIYPGRLRELMRAHHENPVRPKIRPGEIVPDPVSPGQPEIPGEWLVLKAIGGMVPDIQASALVCRAIRRALMSGYRRAGMASKIPRVVSGHEPDGKPTRQPHLAIAPMAFAGSLYANGRVLGFSLIPPPGMLLPDISGFREAFAAIAHYDKGQERRVLILEGSPLREQLHLSPVATGDMTKSSLLSEPYLKPSSIWASVTPMVLDRHLKKNDENEMRELVATSCENAGLPRPSLDRIYIGKHSSVNGAPPTRISYRVPSWTRWKVPKALSTRSLVHVTIDFVQEVSGPILLGAGRFTGLGLCRRIQAGS